MDLERTDDLTMADFPAFCRSHGLKCTAQRQAVFAVIRRLGDHPSVDSVWSQVRRRISSVTRESVYRILNEFSQLGLLSRLDALPAARYDTWMGPHAHFICERCGKVVDYPLPAALPLPVEMPRCRRHLELRVTGLCDCCAQASGGKGAYGSGGAHAPSARTGKSKTSKTGE